MIALYCRIQEEKQPPVHSAAWREKVFDQIEQKTVKMGIFEKKRRIGQTIISIERSGSEAKVASVTELDLPLQISTRLTIHKIKGLTDFRCEMQKGSFKLFALSEQTEDGLALIMTDGNGNRISRIAVGDGMGLSNGFSPFIAMPPLVVGARWPINYYNPLTGGVGEGEAEVLEKVRHPWKDGFVNAYRVRFHAKFLKVTVMEADIIVTPEGDVLEEEIRLIQSMSRLAKRYVLRAEDVTPEDLRRIRKLNERL